MALSYRASRSELDSAPVRPSLEAHGGRRLSKPRTKTLASTPSTTALDSSLTVSPKHSPASNRSNSTLDLISSGSALSPTRSRQKLHSSSFEDVATQNGKEEEFAGKKVTSVKQKISRTSTILSKRTSVRMSLGPLKSQSRISLQTTLEVSAEEKHRMIDEIRQKAHNDSTIALNYASSTGESSEGQVAHAPIRRRSLFTPGLATRNPADFLKKPPERIEQVEEQLDDYDRYYNPMLSESSPLGRLAALDLANSKRPFTPVSRSSTPADLDHGRIGSQCQLRITNGATSPGPSIISMAATSRKSSGEPYYQDSFYTASEGVLSDSEDMPTMRSINRRSFEFVDRLLTPRASQLELAQHGRVCTPLNGPRSARRVASPLRSESQLDTDSEYLEMPTSNSESYFNQLPVDGASMFAQQYIDDISVSPFASFTNLGQTPQFESTSKANEFEAELFDDPASRPGSADLRTQSPQRWSTTFATENGNLVQVNSSSNVPQTTTTYGSSVTTQVFSSTVSTLQGQGLVPGPALEKADSGYSSSTSLRSGANKRMSPLSSLPSNSSATTLSREESYSKGQEELLSTEPVPRSSVGVETPYVTILDGQEPLSRPLTRMQSRLREPSPERGRTPTVRTAYRKPYMPVSKFMAPIGFISVPESPEVPPEPIKVEEEARGRSSSRPGKKLQKKQRPKSMPPSVNRITVSGNREISGTHVPDVPADMAARHAARLQDFPPLERTVPGFGGESGRYQDTEVAPVLAPLRFPSPMHSPVNTTFAPKKRVFSGRRISFTKKPSQYFPTEEQRPALEPSKSQRRWSRQRSPEVFEFANISDFGDVADALGHSPYDDATSYSTNSVPNRSKRGSLIHPHQFTTAMPRAKSMVGLNDAQAAELSQLRNHYGHFNYGHVPPPVRPPPAPLVEDQCVTQAPLAETEPTIPVLPPLRNPSTIRWSFDDRGGIPGKMPRAKSLAFDAPPVPAIPVRAQVDDMERQAKASRHQSVQPASGEKWDSFTAAWAQRRKSAGEGLLTRPDQAARSESDTTVPVERKSHDGTRSGRRPRPMSVQVTHNLTENISMVKRSSPDNLVAVPTTASRSQTHESLAPAPSRPHLAPPQHSNPSLSKSSSSTSLRARDLGVSVQAGLVARLSGRFEQSQPRQTPNDSENSSRSSSRPSSVRVGRFEGGLHFGFEPGRGLGGSAGTRNSKSLASRKSVDWSKGYGVDLSDIPIFVMPHRDGVNV